MDTATAEDRIAAFRSNHRISITVTQDPDLGQIARCDVDGLRVHPMRNGRYRHDTREALALLDSVYGGSWISGQAHEVERRIERVVESMAAEEDEDDPNGWGDREGMPEFNGSFR